jgi:thiamine biosynthesis protein ThiS
MPTGLAGRTTTLTVNGCLRAVPKGATLAELLAELQLDPRMIVVEHNQTILREREEFHTRTLSDGDTLELVHFVGGG